MNENKDMTVDVFNGEDRGLVYVNGKAFMKGSNSFIVKTLRGNTKDFESLNKIVAYATKNNIADIWYISNEWDYSYDVNNLDEYVKDIVKAIPNGDGENFDLLIEDTYKRGIAMVCKYQGQEEKGKWVQSGEYCLVIC